MIPRRLRLVALLFPMVILGGVIGYVTIEGFTWLEALYMVSITLTTIGFGEVHELSDQGRIFTLGLILCGVGVFSYSISQVTRYVLEGDLRKELLERSRRKLVDELRDHYVVAGYGRLGAEVAAELLHAGREVVVVDRSAAAIGRCEADGIAAIHGDASSDSVLLQCHIERAHGLAVASSSNAINILVTLSARALNAELRILTRVDGEEAARKAVTAGASDVISPYGLGGNHMAHGLLRPEARDFLHRATLRTFDDIAFEDIRVLRTGLTGELGELDLQERFGVTLVAVRKADGLLIQPPMRHTVLACGDTVVAVGRPDNLARLAEVAMGSG